MNFDIIYANRKCRVCISGALLVRSANNCNREALLLAFVWLDELTSEHAKVETTDLWVPFLFVMSSRQRSRCLRLLLMLLFHAASFYKPVLTLYLIYFLLSDVI